ncbi:SCO family protein [Halosolutus amylolyticus]|uniref:SCO family protein n=1 Tax=Halosolutus amylolyticus TaxID=2932267 RepID=A0ABD5PPK3_9EURY|nr:SCO family protein [Halosolutus amylolyticus]
MERRTYLRSLGVAGLAGVAGCLDDGLAGIGSNDETVLDPPEVNRGDPSHPIHGEEFPSFSIPDPITGEMVSRDDFVGETPFVMTYFYSSCPDGACPALLLRLRRIQEDAAERGYEDDVGLLAVTFDPERDTGETLEQYAVEQGVDLDAGNWHFLRPEGEDEARAVIYEDFGMRYERVDDMDELEDGSHDANDGDADGNESEQGSHGNETGSDHDEHDHGEYMFTHYNLITLVNEDGIVERAYPNAIADREDVSIETIVEDTRTVVTD